eukprot:UN03291
MSINPRHTAVWQGLINKLGPAGADVVSQMLCLNPKCRLTTSEALQHPFFRNTTIQSNTTSNTSSSNIPCQHQQQQSQQNQQQQETTPQQNQQQQNNNNNNSKYGHTREPEMNQTASAHSQISNTSQTPSNAVAVAATGGNNNGQDTPQPPNVTITTRHQIDQYLVMDNLSINLLPHQ